MTITNHHLGCKCGPCSDARREAALVAAKEMPLARRSAADGSGSSLELFSFCPGCGGALYRAVEHICPNRGLDRKWAVQMDMTIDEYIAEYNATVRREEADGVGADICIQNETNPASGSK